jgi:hypothetical protein
MATSDQLQSLICASRERDMITARYGGARLMTTAMGFALPEFTFADDPTRRWLEWCRDNPGPVAGAAEAWATALAAYLAAKED